MTKQTYNPIDPLLGSIPSLIEFGVTPRAVEAAHMECENEAFARKHGLDRASLERLRDRWGIKRKQER